MKARILMFILLICSFVLADDVLLLNLHYKDGEVSLRSQELLKGYSPDRMIQEGDYDLVIKDKGNKRLYSFNFDIPNKVYVDSSEGGDVIYLNDFNFYLLVPYYRDAKNIAVVKEDKVLSNLEIKDEQKDYTILYLFLVLLLVGIVLFFVFLKINRNAYKK